jgi:hypothetical protein
VLAGKLGRNSDDEMKAKMKMIVMMLMMKE